MGLAEYMVGIMEMEEEEEPGDLRARVTANRP
jgi:hypothetical protein